MKAFALFLLLYGVMVLFVAIWGSRALRSVARHWPYIGCCLLLITAIAGGAHAAEKPKLTNAQALSLLQAMRNLDGRMVVVKQNGQDTPIMLPWDFGSGTLRLAIAKNLGALSDLDKSISVARNAVVKELLAKMPADDKGRAPVEIPPGTPERAEFDRQIDALLGAPAEVTLVRIRASDLKLDKNEVPVTALSALLPVLDDDVSPKDEAKK